MMISIARRALRACPVVVLTSLTIGVGCAPQTSGQSAGGTIASPTGPAAQTAIRTVAARISGADIHRDASYLASDALRGRATVSRSMEVTPGMDSAAAFISRRLRELGVRPLGDNGTYLRHYTLRRSELDPARTTASAAGRPLQYGRDFVVMTFNALGVHDAPIAYVGHGLIAEKQGLDAYRGVDVRGKWLLVHGRYPQGVTRQSLGLRIGDYSDAAEEVRQRGAAGIITIGSPQEFSQLASRTTPPSVRDITPTAGRSYAPPALPQIMISPAGLQTLLRGEALNAAQVLAGDSSGTFPGSVELRTRLRVDIAGSNVTARPYNVIGVIDGADPQLRNEYITVASHLDGAVGTGVVDGDSIYNSADDNASGSAGNLAIARALMETPRPRRSVVLIWDTGEETGLWGSRSLAYSPFADSIVAHFNIDMIGRTDPNGTGAMGDNALSGPGEVFVAGPRELSPHLDALVNGIERDYGFIAFDRQFDVIGNQFFYPRTDASPYFERGIPFIEFFTGIHGDYHRPADNPEKLDPAKMEAVTRAAFATIWTVANDPVKPRIEVTLPPRLKFITPRR